MGGQMTTDKQSPKEFWIPLLSCIVALAGILSAFLTQFYITQTTVEPKLSDFEAEAHFMMQKILLKQQF
jgi:hypothetical protein